MMPNTGTPCSMSPMLIVNSGLCRMKARVPSSGSTRKNASRVAGMRPAATRLLGDDRHAGRSLRESGEQRLLRLVIGDRDRGGVGLGRDLHARREMAHLDSARGKHRRQQRIDERPEPIGRHARHPLLIMIRGAAPC